MKNISRSSDQVHISKRLFQEITLGVFITFLSFYIHIKKLLVQSRKISSIPNGHGHIIRKFPQCGRQMAQRICSSQNKVCVWGGGGGEGKRGNCPNPGANLLMYLNREIRVNLYFFKKCLYGSGEFSLPLPFLGPWTWFRHCRQVSGDSQVN